MSLTKKGEWWHGAAPEDLDSYLLGHVLAQLCQGRDHRVVHASCGGCGGTVFDLFTDDQSRILRVCKQCEAEHKICDLDKRFDDESAGEIVCTCMYSECEVAVGFSLSEPPNGDPESPSVGYLYVAGRCQECGLCGVYGEWSPDGDFPFGQFAQSV